MVVTALNPLHPLDFLALWARARIAERFDIGIMPKKCMSTTGPRGSPCIDKVLVAHDFDVWGFSIFGTLGCDGRRFRFHVDVPIVGLGLRLSGGLPVPRRWRITAQALRAGVCDPLPTLHRRPHRRQRMVRERYVLPVLSPILLFTACDALDLAVDVIVQRHPFIISNYRACHTETPSARFRNRCFVRWCECSQVIRTTYAPFTNRCWSLVGNSGGAGCASLSLRCRGFLGLPPYVAPVPGCAISN